jgi:hypothetical protein
MLVIDRNQYDMLKKLSGTLPDVILNDRQICDFELLVTGAFAPLKGFMTRVEYESVLDRMRLSSGDLWPVPICLDIHDTLANTLEAGQSVALRDPEGFLLGIMTLEDIWPVDRDAEARAVYGTRDRTHPGVNYLYNRSGSFYHCFPYRPVRSRQIHHCQDPVRPVPGNRHPAGVTPGRGHCAAPPVFGAQFFQGTQGHQRAPHRIRGIRDHQKPGHCHLCTHCSLPANP